MNMANPFYEPAVKLHRQRKKVSQRLPHIPHSTSGKYMYTFGTPLYPTNVNNEIKSTRLEKKRKVEWKW